MFAASTGRSRSWVIKHISRHDDHSLRTFLKRTVAAQLHLIGFLLAIAGSFWLLPLALRKAGMDHFWCCLIFTATGIILFGVSTTYHFLADGYKISPQLDRKLENLDHFAIYLFIAGTYTPFLMNAVRSPWREILLAGIWIIGAVGILYTHFKHQLPEWAQRRWVYTGLFILMGWTLMIRFGEVFASLSNYRLIMMVAGGLSYSLGAVVYALKRPKLVEGFFGFHELWHVMVLAGFTFHFFMILNFY